MEILTWNIKDLFRAASDPDPFAALGALPDLPDVLTLQEVTLAHAPAVRERLHDMGYATQYSCSPDAAGMKYGNVIAARTRVNSGDLATFNFPFPELAAYATVDTPNGPINVVTVHVPNGTNHGWKKIDTLEALKRLVLGLKGQALVVTGDFNEPDWELQDGRILTFGQDKRDGDRWLAAGTWTDKSGVTDKCERWDAAVRWFFECPKESGLHVAFWEDACHGAMEASHFAGGKPRWFDHIFVSDYFGVQSCKYRHDFRERGFSDHSALMAILSHAPG